jgi:hypothetical protein
LIAAGDKASGKKALEASFATPNLWPVAELLAAYDADGERARITDTCTKARTVTKSDEEKYALLDVCFVHAHAPTPEVGLAWAPKGDVTFYERRRAEEGAAMAQDAQAARAKSDADRRALYADLAAGSSKSASPPSGGGSAASTGASGPISVTIRSACSKTARVFYGKDPKFGGGTTSSVSSNEVGRHTFQSGDMIWVVDDSENGLASVSVSTSTKEIEIGRDCRSLVAR